MMAEIVYACETMKTKKNESLGLRSITTVADDGARNYKLVLGESLWTP